MSVGGYRRNGESVTCNGTGRNYSCNEYKERKSMVFNYDSILEYENLVINPMEQVVFYKEVEIEFTNREFQVLYLLLLHRGIVLSKRQIYEQITDDNEKIDYHTIEITISRIRKKLKESTGRSDFIITVRDRGYKFSK